MSRFLYRCLISLHPPAFREQFAGEMQWIFEEAAEREGVAPLFVDAFVSLARQWVLRTELWKVAVALIGGFLQVAWGVAALTNMHAQSATYFAGRYNGSWTGSLHATEPTPLEMTLANKGEQWSGHIRIDDPGVCRHSGPADV